MKHRKSRLSRRYGRSASLKVLKRLRNGAAKAVHALNRKIASKGG
jgi:hypothetical protein